VDKVAQVAAEREFELKKKKSNIMKMEKMVLVFKLLSQA
jgi:hypothetical protein